MLHAKKQAVIFTAACLLAALAPQAAAAAEARLPLALEGWSVREGAAEPDYTGGDTLTLAGNARLYAVYDLSSLDLCYRGNGATACSREDAIKDASGYYFLQKEIGNLTPEHRWSPSVTEANPFVRREYDAAADRMREYSFVGWSLQKDSTYLQKDQVIRAGSRNFLDGSGIDWVKLIASSLRNGTYTPGSGAQDLYAVWDAYPEAQIRDTVVNSGEIDSLSRETLLKAVVRAWDAEDKENVTVSISDDEIAALKKGLHDLSGNPAASLSVFYEVRDGFGNVARIAADVWVNRETPDERTGEDGTMGRAKDGYLRYVSPISYQKSEEDGGLGETSLWRTKEEYVRVLQDAFAGIGTYESRGVASYNDSAQGVWRFSHEDVLEAQAFLNDYGIGRSKRTMGGADPLALWKKRFPPDGS